MAWVLAVDFGTTNTVAAVADPSGVRVLNVNGRPVMASAVFLHDDGWYVGDTAVRMARHRLDRFEACPKRAIPDGTLFLGGHDVPVADAVTALFRPLLTEALEQHNGVPPNLFVVTHPATWTASRVEILLAAAAAAAPGPWPRPQPLPEPVAAAQRVLHIENMPAVARLVVLDLGGGTTDVTVVDRHGGGLTVAGNPIGRDGLGGVDFDLRLARWMVAEVDAPGLYDRLAGAQDPELRERAVDIREHARDVKEQLSQRAVVPAQLPKSPPELPTHTPVQVSRPVLESLIRGDDEEPGLEQAVALVDDALRAAPPGPPMTGVFLVGGSSRIPLLGTLVTQRTGRIPIRHGDPTTAVAEGAARFGWGVLHGEHDQVRGGYQPHGVGQPAPGYPPHAMPSHPITSQAMPSPGQSGAGQPMPGAGQSMAGQPMLFLPIADRSMPSPYGPPPPPQFPTPRPSTRSPGTKVALLVVLLLLVVAGVTFTVFQVSGGPSDGPTNGPTATEISESSTGIAMIDVPVFESPSLSAATVSALAPGQEVAILCTTSGDPVQNPQNGRISDLWDRVEGGYVPDVVIDTGTSAPTMPSC